MNYRTFAVLTALASLVLRAEPAVAQHRIVADCINSQIHGTLLDFTRNSGWDRRIYSAALCECRDMYVYLPPGYDASRRYPLLVWLHSYTDDECEFVRSVVPALDEAIVSGELPPLIVAAPDGSISGDYHLFAFGSWYVNSSRGRFADYISQDVLKFLEDNFSVCRDRAGRAIAGFSMGGFGAYSIGLKNPDKFKLVAGIAPALNLRHSGPCNDYRADFVPGQSYLRAEFRRHEVIGEFYGGFMKVRAWMIVEPVFGSGTAAIDRVSRDNPIELLDRLNVQPGVQDYYASYARDDELNIDAQVESFLYAASQRGITVTSRCYPCGDHSIPFMLRALPDFFAWLQSHLNCPTEDSTPGHALLQSLISTRIARSPTTASEAVLILPRP